MLKLARTLSRGLLPVAALITVSSSPAFAVDYILSIGHDASTDSGGQVTVQTGDRFLIDFSASRSYACDAIPTASTTDFDWSATVTGQGVTAESITARLAGAIVPQTGGESGGNADNRLTLTPTTTDRFALTVANTAVGGETIRVRCYATTLFGGYNTNVNDFNFLELTNIGNQTISGTITAINFDGTTVINAQAFSVPAQRRVDVDLHTPAGADKFGLVRVTTDGPFGTLLGNVSQYSGTVTSFSLQTSDALVPFDQKP